MLILPVTRPFVWIIASALIAGCTPHSDAPASKISPEAMDRHYEWLKKNEIPGSHQGKWASYEAMHRFFVDYFVKSDGFGVERLPTPRDIARNSALLIHGTEYMIGGVDLISLGRSTEDAPAEPFAYTTGFRARAWFMTDVVKARLGSNKKRPLSPFELEALSTLRAGQETVLGSVGDQPLLIGAVRATTSCLECHKVKEHTLLGAFSYPLLANHERAIGIR